MTLSQFLRSLDAAATPGPWGPGKFERECIAADGGAGLVVLRRTNDGTMPGMLDMAAIIQGRNLLGPLAAYAEAGEALLETLNLGGADTPLHRVRACAQFVAFQAAHKTAADAASKEPA